MRKTKETPDFPYASGRVCYIEAAFDGHISQVGSSSAEKVAAYQNVKAGKSSFYAV